MVYIRKFESSYSGQKTVLKSNSVIWSPRSKSVDIVRVMKMCMSFIASQAGCLGDLHCTGIGRCFCSFLQKLSIYHPSPICLHKRQSYVNGLAIEPGNARTFLA